MSDFIGHLIRALIWEYRKQKRQQRAVEARRKKTQSLSGTQNRWTVFFRELSSALDSSDRSPVVGLGLPRGPLRAAEARSRKTQTPSTAHSPSGSPDVAERLNPDPLTGGEYLAIIRAGRRGDAEALEIMGSGNPEAMEEWGVLMRQHIERNPGPPARTLRETVAIVRAARRGNEAAWAIVYAEDDGKWFG